MKNKRAKMFFALAAIAASAGCGDSYTLEKDERTATLDGREITLSRNNEILFQSRIIQGKKNSKEVIEDFLNDGKIPEVIEKRGFKVYTCESTVVSGRTARVFQSFAWGIVTLRAPDAKERYGRQRYATAMDTAYNHCLKNI